MSAQKKQAKRTIAIASDHAGFSLKEYLVQLLNQWGFEVSDLGTHNSDSVDYPKYACQVARGVTSGNYSLGVLVCGTGIGMSIVANRIPGVRAALCTSAYMARLSRTHNNANILCLGARVIGFGEAEDILKTFVSKDFEGGRHARRVDQIESIHTSGEK